MTCSPTLSQISLKYSFGKVVFHILAKFEMMRNKNRLFGRHFATVHYFFFSRIMVLIHIYDANFIAKFRWEKVFSTDLM